MASDEKFVDRLCAEIVKKKSVLCCGLDPQLRYMPPHLIRQAVQNFGVRGPNDFVALGWLFTEFNKRIIDAVCDIVACVKPQLAFYEDYGSVGLKVLEDTIAYAKSKGLLVIADAKRGDGGDTADAYADGYLGEVPFFGTDDPTTLTRVVSPVRVDCMTVHGYIGEACVCPFVDRIKEYGTGIFVVDKTSFKPNSAVEQLVTTSGRPVWQELAVMVQKWGEGTEGACGLRNVGVVMGATYPDDAPKMRVFLPNSILLIPGFGGQGATADDAVAGIRADGFGGVVNDSRSLLYAYLKGRYQCKSEEFVDASRARAVDANAELIFALKKANKWPHG